jgi:Cation transport ATPase (P-type)
MNYRLQSQILVQLRENQATEAKNKIEKKSERKKLEIVGDASETALLRFCDEFKDTDSMRIKYEKIFEVPFNSKVSSLENSKFFITFFIG